MTSAEVECFLETAFRHSFTKAGESLHLAPQAVNKNVRKLEIALNTVLFTRKKQSVELTEAGKFYFSLFSSAAISLQQILSECKAHNIILENYLRIGVSEWLFPCSQLLRGIKLLREKRPTLRLNLVSLPSEDLISMVEGSQLDLAFLSSAQYVASRDVNLRSLCPEHMRLLAPRSLVPENPDPEAIRTCFSLPVLLPTPAERGFFDRFSTAGRGITFDGVIEPATMLHCKSPDSMAAELMLPRYSAVTHWDSGRWNSFERDYYSFPLRSDAELLCIWPITSAGPFLENVVTFLSGFFQETDS